MKLYCEGYTLPDFGECTEFIVYVPKKTLIKFSQEMGISNWKDFWKNEYISDDTFELIDSLEYMNKLKIVADN